MVVDDLIQRASRVFGTPKGLRDYSWVRTECYSVEVALPMGELLTVAAGPDEPKPKLKLRTATIELTHFVIASDETKVYFGWNKEAEVAIYRIADE